jgi:pimeloyl-ACP methyl ester carboxylesterase
MNTLKSAAAVVGVALSGVAAIPANAADIVMVHGMNMDGGAWRLVRDELAAKGHKVTIVQLPMTSIEDDIAATNRAIKAQDGPIVLVGHSYGGMVISQSGIDPSVRALVYVAAFLPEVGESLAELNASQPSQLPADASIVFDDGFYVVEPGAWLENVANGLPQADAEFTAHFQTPVNTAIFGYKAEFAAWHDKPSWSIVASQDRTISPELQRKMTERSGANAIELATGHLPQLTHPSEVVAVIEKAAATVAP